MTVLGVCGLGSIGRRHVRVLANLGVGLVVCDPDLDDEFTAQLPPGTTIANSVAALIDADIEGLVVATPDESHVEIASAACARRIPTLVEKPISNDMATGRRLVALSRQTGTPLLVGYVLRYNRSLRRVKELLDASAIGTVVSFHVTLGAYETLLVARRRFQADDYGSLFRDYSHEWDYLRWLLAPVDGVFALARRAGEREHQRDPNIVDAVVRLTDGITGTVHLDYVQHPGERRLSLIGDAGTLAVDVPRGLIELHTEFEGSRQETYPNDRDAMFTAQAEHFLAVITGRAQPSADGQDGLAALAVADAATRSARCGSWVDVAEVTG